jgi:hypothetical protein
MKIIIDDHQATLKNKIVLLVFSAFKLLHRGRFKQKAWNGKPYIKLIAILGLRTAIVESYSGQRSKNSFYWKIGKYHI